MEGNRNQPAERARFERSVLCMPIGSLNCCFGPDYALWPGVDMLPSAGRGQGSGRFKIPSTQKLYTLSGHRRRLRMRLSGPGVWPSTDRAQQRLSGPSACALLLPQVGWAGLQWPGKRAPLDGKQVVGAASRLNLPRWSPLKGVLWRRLFATCP